MSIHGILFDFDGTLVDSEPLHCRVWQQLLADYAISFSKQDYKDLLLGVPSVRSAALLVERLSLATSAETLLQQRNNALKAQLHASPPPLMPYAEEILADLKQRGLKLALVTASDRESVEATLAAHGLTGTFDATVTGGDVRQPKPHPEGYRRALQLLGLTPQQTIAVEDSSAGIKAARGAGLPCAGIRNHFSRPHDLLGATRAFDHLRDAHDWIRPQLG